MTSATRTSIGFIGPSGGKSPHYEPFKRLIPREIDLDIRDLGVMRDQSLESLGGHRDQIVARAVELSVSAGWAGVLVPGAPVSVRRGRAQWTGGGPRVAPAGVRGEAPSS